MISYDLSIPKIMMVLDETVVEGFKGSISDQLEANRLKLRRLSL